MLLFAHSLSIHFLISYFSLNLDTEQMYFSAAFPHLRDLPKDVEVRKANVHTLYFKFFFYVSLNNRLCGYVCVSLLFCYNV